MLRFTASGTSIQPPPTPSPFIVTGTSWQPAYWPAEVTVSTTSGSASSGSVTIPVRGSLHLNSCSGGFVLLPRL
jgi:hypothetical protein